MSCNCADETQPCSCCAGVAAATPTVIANAPALSSVAYRTGVFGSFKASMLAQLSGSTMPELASLRTRETSDFSIAMLDAWAVTLDILSFYNERLANEAFLGTAVDGRSVFELARLVGYQPSPGVSASVLLAFSPSTAPGSPTSFPLPAGTRVQSVPKPGETPQVFETSTALTATIAAAAIPIATTQPWQLKGGDTSTWIASTAANLHVGDALLFLKTSGGVASAAGPGDLRFVTGTTIDAIGGRTQVRWDKPLSSFTATTSDVCLYVMRRKAALNGAQSPYPSLFAATSTSPIPPPGISSSGDWAFSYNSDYVVQLDGAYAGLLPSGDAADSANLQWMVLQNQTNTCLFAVSSVTERSAALYALSTKTSAVTISSGTSLAGTAASTVNAMIASFVGATRSTTVYAQSDLLPLGDLPVTAWSGSSQYPLSPGMLAPVAGGTLLLRGGQGIAANANLALSGKRVRLQVVHAGGAQFTPAGQSGSVTVSIGQSFRVDSFPPTAGAGSTAVWQVLNDDGMAGTLVTSSGAVRFAPALTADAACGEPLLVSAVAVLGATTEVGLAAQLSRIYDAGTVTVNANAVMATHGETTQEILGSGDAGNAALQLPLKTAPLTYVSSSSERGVASTLQVWVNNLRWKEVPNLLDAGPADRVFVTRANSAGKVTVQFGNGIDGARTPTGSSNLRALYRKGIGAAGMVDAGQLTLPLDRPQGLQSVTNPGAATGGADPSTPDEARTQAALPTLTMGRIVSLDDYASFAQGFAGIAKAAAVAMWFGSTRGVFLTVAGAGGAVLNANDPIIANLYASLRGNGLPHVPVRIASYRPVPFDVAARLKIDSDTYDPDTVKSAAWASLTSAFAFAKASVGERVAASQVISILQSTPGVVAVELLTFDRSGSGDVAAMLCAAAPQPPLGAELLLLDPSLTNGLEVWS